MVNIFEFFSEKYKSCNNTYTMEQLKLIRIRFDRTIAPAMSAPNKKLLA